MRYILSVFIMMVTISCNSELKNISYSSDIYPIIKKNCYECHNSSVKEGKIDLSNYESIIRLVEKGKAKQSRLYIVVSTQNEGMRMPPVSHGKDRLSERDVNKIKIWINEGALKN